MTRAGIAGAAILSAPMNSKLLSKQDILDAELTAGKRVFRRFIDANKEGQTVAPEDLQFLVTAFEQILDGRDPKKALKLERGQGRSAKTAQEQDADLLIAVDVFIEHLARNRTAKRVGRPGVSMNTKFIVADRHGLEVWQLDSILKKHRSMAEKIALYWADIPARHQKKEALRKALNNDAIWDALQKKSARLVDLLVDAYEESSFDEPIELMQTIKLIVGG